MSLIRIIEGSLKGSYALYEPQSIFRSNPQITIITGTKKKIYDVRGSVISVDTIIEHKAKPTVKVTLRDGNIFIGKMKRSEHDDIKIAISYRPEPAKTVNPLVHIPEPQIRDENNDQVQGKQTLAAPAFSFDLPVKKKSKISQFVSGVLVIIITMIVLSFVSIFVPQERSNYQRQPHQSVPVTPLTPEQAAAQEIARKEAQAQREKSAREARAERLINNVKAFEDFLISDEEYFKANKASDADFEKIRKTLVLFSSLAEHLDNARLGKADLSTEDITYLKGVEARTSSFQQKVFPGLRLAFKKGAAELLWEHDVDVYVSGTGNTVIEFTSGMFAARANIKSTQEQIHEIVTQLRFKTSRFTWYKGSDGHQYKLATPPDGKLASFKFGEFQEMAAGYP